MKSLTLTFKVGDDTGARVFELYGSIEDGAPIDGALQDLAARLARSIRMEAETPRLPRPDHSRIDD